MSIEDCGTEQTTDEDRAYKGSRFSEVRDALFANPYQRIWGARDEPVLPRSHSQGNRAAYDPFAFEDRS